MLSSVLTFWTKDGPPIVWHSEPRDTYRSRVRGCLLGGALGDALGAPVEFSTLAQIRAAHGPAGVRSHVDPRALVTDDTQMTLWTVDGLIRARVRQAVHGGEFDPTRAVHDAYLRWYHTQFVSAPTGEHPGWLAARSWLYHQRAPGRTCLQALQDAVGGRQERGAPASNGSKGCGGVMRSAPFGLLPDHVATDTAVFAWADRAAALTHGHPTGQRASGALALLIRRLLAGDDLDTALDAVLTELRGYTGHEETTRALLAARTVAAGGAPSAEHVESLGEGWIAEEALAIAVYAALVHRTPAEVTDALALAVSHSGDSDSTGAICGNILGALHGEAALPPDLADPVEGRADLLQLADDFMLAFASPGPPTTAEWLARYPAD
ncbi:putative ADP-ribosylglycohydrolase [Thermobifida fusca YX]|uniref:ADP-ribosylglycohydrolase n=2 Tax=Thermobifida fusca TaxID=2021 RepID=A0A9P2TBG6_THEFU|nr:putative ADP-ribosylglycohydrolase [Thermobifida fusca YX]EOR71930.1 ADP-ribosylglycohydrolase [Thermobifida fusca TM51]MBO2531049.1 ADP-ribosylglycohydrolase [Thermobifida sp.]PPS92557.1 ADP-ribosylglycohydrolase [Thermobifida fusca]PZN62501.1 MAG: ADP-ribosylglycohydrolase [Thermobifida fusca]